MDKLKHEHVYKCTLCADEITRDQLNVKLDKVRETLKFWNEGDMDDSNGVRHISSLTDELEEILG